MYLASFRVFLSSRNFFFVRHSDSLTRATSENNEFCENIFSVFAAVDAIANPWLKQLTIDQKFVLIFAPKNNTKCNHLIMCCSCTRPLLYIDGWFAIFSYYFFFFTHWSRGARCPMWKRNANIELFVFVFSFCFSGQNSMFCCCCCFFLSSTQTCISSTTQSICCYPY